MSEITPFWYWRQRLWIWLRYGVFRKSQFLHDFAVEDLNRFYRAYQREMQQ